MKNGHYVAIAIVIGLLYFGNIGGFQTTINTYVARLQTGGGITIPGGGVVTTTVGGPVGSRGPFAVEFTLKSQDGALQTSRSVDFYTYSPSRALWTKDSRQTSASTTGLVTSTKIYYEGQELYINIPAVASTIDDFWVKVKVLSWQGDPFTTINIETIPAYGRVKEQGQITVYKTTTSASYLAVRLYGEDSTSISTTSASATSRSKASGLADMEAYFELEVNTAAWQAFGKKFDVPATDQGALARTLTSVFYVEVNSTSFDFDTANGVGSTQWAQATASSASNRKYVIEVPQVETRDKYPVKIQVYFYADFNGLADDTGLSLSTAWTDQQTLANALNGVTYAGSGANIGYTRSESNTFYITIAA